MQRLAIYVVEEGRVGAITVQDGAGKTARGHCIQILSP
jgi:hypothetical protein